MSDLQFSRYQDTPALPCPECRDHGVKGNARIGGRKGRGCKTCNNFNQTVLRRVGSMLRDRHADEYLQLRIQVTKDMYPRVIEDYVKQKGLDG